MRWCIVLLLLLSFKVYSGPDIPCIPGEMQWNESVFCPTLTTFVASALSSIHTHDATTNKKNKIILNSKDHAITYIISDGEVSSVYLEQAFIILKKEYPNAIDMELAKAILAY